MPAVASTPLTKLRRATAVLTDSDVVERAGVGVEERVREAVRRPGRLVGERHEAREDRRREARAADAVLVVVTRPSGKVCVWPTR